MKERITVRRVNKNGTIDSASNPFATAGQAKTEAKRLTVANGWKPPQYLVDLYY